jgi:hypothetical protein
LAVAVAVAAVGFAAVATAVGATGVASSRAATAQQGAKPSVRACIAKWNRQRIRLGDVPNPYVKVYLSRRACRVAVGNFDLNAIFTCWVNAYGTYQCPGHGDPLTSLSASFRMWNARLDGRGTLILNLPVPLRHYATRQGYILPWDRNGRLKQGLRFIEQHFGACQIGFSLRIPSPGTDIARCFGEESIIRDPCFGSHSDIKVGDVVACSIAPGARTFVRFVVQTSS